MVKLADIDVLNAVLVNYSLIVDMALFIGTGN